LEKARAKRKERYASMEEFKKAIQPYLYSYPYKSYYFKIDSFLIPVTRFGYFSKIIRIPFSGSVPLFKEAVDIIDTKDFQRLRGVRQLGPTQFVYPGAGHTRFEHSLGAYFLSLKYLEVLLRNPLFYEAVEDIEEATKLVVLGSLLHDIGHHPFSHWIEELKGLPDELAFVRHEDRAKDIILKGEIGENIRTRWRIDPSKVCRLIAGGKLSPREELLRSIVDSDIDVDRIDYLQRDSAHCGVPYGLAFDVERLVGSLWVNKAHNKICLTDKGRSSFISLLVSNIIMYQEVYWHKTTRACTAMFKRFFYECLVKGKISIERITRKYLFYPDEKFIETLYNINRKDKELTSLIRPFLNEGRVLHKPVLVHNYGSPLCLIHDNTKDFFNKLAEKDYPKQVEMTLHLAEILKKSQLPELKEYDIILETTPVEYREVAELSGFEFYDTRLEEYEGLTPEIHILNNYLRSNRRAYLYCKPKFYDQMRHLVKNGKMNDIFGDVIEKI
jgi:HD superfamily phosphohydrolase